MIEHYEVFHLNFSNIMGTVSWFPLMIVTSDVMLFIGKQI